MLCIFTNTLQKLSKLTNLLLIVLTNNKIFLYTISTSDRAAAYIVVPIHCLSIFCKANLTNNRCKKDNINLNSNKRRSIVFYLNQRKVLQDLNMQRSIITVSCANIVSMMNETFKNSTLPIILISCCINQ